MKSTSLHSLNADKGLNLAQKPLYILLNLINNLFPYSNVDGRIEIKGWAGEDWKKGLDKTYKESSVGRRLSDLFWHALPWEKIKEELEEIHVFDTGCGSGNYGARLMDASGGAISSYTGIDAKEKPNWQELMAKYPNLKLIKSSSSDISSLIPKGANLFITQSAIEHFDEDIRFFEQIREYIESADKPVIQIHNFPAKGILPLYLFHGVRQYTPRNISKITRLFKNSDIYLYGLGGRAGKKVQWKYFTWPLLILRRQALWSKDVPKYDSDVRKAIEYDILNPSKSPIFWVLIIHSHPQNHIWKK